MRVGYRRVSSIDQSLDRQDLGDCERIFEEKLSGGTADRPALQEMIAFVRSGDEVVVHSIDRLARNLMDLQNIINELNDKGASVHFITEQLTFSSDGGSAFQTLQLQMLGAFAQFEKTMIKKRQAEGIAKAKARGSIPAPKKSTHHALACHCWSASMHSWHADAPPLRHPTSLLSNSLTGVWYVQ